MRIQHSAIKSPIYEIIKVVELDLQLGDESWPVRFELFQNTETAGHFRCRIWQAERFRIQSTSPSSPDGTPQDQPSDELILIRFDGPKMDDYEDFTAAGPDAALAAVLRDFGRFLEHTTLEKPKWRSGQKKSSC